MVRLLSVFILASGCLTAMAQIVPTMAKDNYTCSPTESCKVGCCGNAGYCGFGPTFCGVGNCTSNCDRKSECDAGWGLQWSNASNCPLNVCCSQYGFCGTTPDFCGDAVVVAPSCSSTGNTANQRVVGYYESWSQQRNCDQMFPDSIPQGAWTHLNFAFIYIDPASYTVVPMDPRDVDLYKNFTNLKLENPGLQTWISVGGWSMNDPGPMNRTFSELAADPNAQAAFSESIIAFMEEWGFDGVDIDWEYPVAEERAGAPEDFENFVTWLTSLRTDLGDQYGLTITIPSSYWYMRHFDIVNLVEIVDWFNIMTYDLHGTWDATNPYVGPYINSHTNLTEIDQTMDLLWRNDIPTDKVVMGLGFYGRSFTLSDPSCSIEGCFFSAGGIAGPCTGNPGTLSFAEIESILSSPADSATVTLNSPAAVQEVVFSTNQWVSYDNNVTFLSKYQYANSHCLSGLVVWAVSNDDAIGSAQRQLCDAIGCTVRAPTDPFSTGPILCGSTTTCSRYHQVIAGDTCYSLYTAANLSFEQFLALNLPLFGDCSNLETGIRYCVEGVPDGSNDTSTCTATSTVMSTFTFTSTVTDSSVSATKVTTTPSVNASSCELRTRVVSYGHTMDL